MNHVPYKLKVLYRSVSLKPALVTVIYGERVPNTSAQNKCPKEYLKSMRIRSTGMCRKCVLYVALCNLLRDYDWKEFSYRKPCIKECVGNM
jgi:hypothetical protein